MTFKFKRILLYIFEKITIQLDGTWEIFDNIRAAAMYALDFLQKKGLEKVSYKTMRGVLSKILRTHKNHLEKEKVTLKFVFFGFSFV